jgi:transcriptional regulator with XRE-family HTH domain
MALGKRVKEARDAAKFSQAQLAEKVGISQAAIHLLEQRDSESSKFLAELARALDVTPDWLKDGRGATNDQRRKYDAGDDKTPSDETHVIIPRYNVAASCGLSSFLSSRTIRKKKITQVIDH